MPELSFYERQHIQKILIQQGAIGNIFNQFSREISGYLRKWTETGKPNVWVCNSSIEKGIDRSLMNLQKNLLDNIQSFGVDAWQRGQAKNDDLVERYIKGMSISSVVKDGMFYRNREALKAFQSRVDNGMTLSERVWKTVEITKDQVELFLGSGLSVSRAAGDISSDVRQLLKNSNRRFRRIRDENGKLQLSAPMKDYHPGQGVYRSSYMNALRLSATNTNMNFRKADHDRWQKMDFVLGIEIKRSASNHGPCKICDVMIGKYPKGFVFTGFHPFCICYAVPVMMNHEEFADFLLDKKIPEGKIITTLPGAAEKYIRDNEEQLSRTKPYWYKGNFIRNEQFTSSISLTSNIQENSFNDLLNRAKQLGINTKRFEPAIEGKYSEIVKASLEKEIERIERITLEKETAKRKLYSAVVKTENEIRMNKTFETSVAFDKDGNVILDKRGESRSVSFTKEECEKMKDTISTHNHPSGWSYPEKSIMRIGNSFSEEDILMAVGNDLAEIRAVTPNYTFALKRPQTGWGVPVDEVQKEVQKLNEKIRIDYQDRIRKGIATVNQASITHWHRLCKEISKKYGWEYSKSKTR